MRQNSLDILRSVAILLVLAYHYSTFVSHSNNFGYISSIGWIGVDLFFVLSGYLIGNQVCRSIDNGRFSIKDFYLRRFFRTFPNYFFVLALYFLIPNFSELPITVSFWKFMLFIQNFHLTESGFSQSWSLCVEEQFYLILPILAMLILNKRYAKFHFALLGCLICGGILLRYFLWKTYMLPYDVSTASMNHGIYIYYPTYSRLDGLVLGVSLSVLKNHHQILWGKITQYGNKWLVAGLSILVIIGYSLKNIDSLTAILVGFTFVSIAFAMIVLSALSNNSILNRYNVSWANRLAVWSFAIYLIQKPISVIVAQHLTSFGLDVNNFWAIIINFVSQIFCGWLLFVCIESPFLRLRDFIFKKPSGKRW